MKKHFLVLFSAVLVILLIGGATRHFYHFYQGAEAAALLKPAPPSPAVLLANPLAHSETLRGTPALIFLGTADTTILPNENGEKMAATLGCRVIRIPGASHTDSRLYQPATVQSFLVKNRCDHLPVVFLHPWGTDSRIWTATLKKSPASPSTFAAQISQSHPILSGDFGNSWGNDAAVSQLENLIGTRPKVVIVGVSMGGALMWRYAEKHPDRIGAMVGIAPVCDLPAVCRRRFGKDINRAYAVQNP